MDEDITYWEKVARTKLGSYLTEIEKGVIFKANSLAGRPTSALEIGCDGGRWTRLLAELGWNMTATDVNPNILKICQKRVPSAKCILVDPCNSKIPCENGSKKLIICIEVFGVFNSDWFMDEAFRTLEHGGLLVCTVSNPLSLRGALHRVAYKIRKDKIDYGYFTATQPYHKYKKKIIQNGFKLIYEEGFCWIPFTRQSDSMFIPVSGRLERFLGLRHITILSPLIIFIAQKI